MHRILSYWVLQFMEISALSTPQRYTEIFSSCHCLTELQGSEIYVPSFLHNVRKLDSWPYVEALLSVTNDDVVCIWCWTTTWRASDSGGISDSCRFAEDTAVQTTYYFSTSSRGQLHPGRSMIQHPETHGDRLLFGKKSRVFFFAEKILLISHLSPTGISSFSYGII